ncbi:MAG: SMP-30/gluconolactonase/LRE family protein [Parabacteroides sp.]|nr:SMP-30/gluconolactonase/LRE family protein [Parabacteroides sp.]
MKTSALFDSLNLLAWGLPAFCLLFLSSCSGNKLTEKPVVAFEAKATTGEGSIWHPERKSLFWVDIEGKTLYEYLPESSTCKTWSFDRMVSTVVPETDSTVVVSLQNEIVRVNLVTGENTHVASIDDKNGTVRCNDGKCDPEGRLWVGTMGFGAPKGAGKLFTVTRDGVVSVMLDSVTISNGIVWTADKRFMYYNDTPTGRVARYKYDAATGAITFDGVAVKMEEGTGSPDGMTIDRNGNLWVAQWGGYGVYCYNPQTGELLKKIELPAPNVASCAFGGENLDILYITTARAGLSEEQLEKYPLSGSLFVCKPGAVGVEAFRFTK